MNNLAALVLSKAVAPFDRAKVKRGEKIDVDFTFRIKGTVRVGEDYQHAPTIPPLTALAVAISHCDPATQELILSQIERAAENAFTTAGGTVKVGGKMNDAISARTEKIIERIRARFSDSLPQVDHEGKITTDLDCQILRR